MPKETRRFTNWLTYQLKKNVSYVGWVIVVLYLAYIHEDNKRQQYFQNQARGNGPWQPPPRPNMEIMPREETQIRPPVVESKSVPQVQIRSPVPSVQATAPPETPPERIIVTQPPLTLPPQTLPPIPAAVQPVVEQPSAFDIPPAPQTVEESQPSWSAGFGSEEMPNPETTLIPARPAFPLMRRVPQEKIPSRQERLANIEGVDPRTYKGSKLVILFSDSDDESEFLYEFFNQRKDAVMFPEPLYLPDPFIPWQKVDLTRYFTNHFLVQAMMNCTYADPSSLPYPIALKGATEEKPDIWKQCQADGICFKDKINKLKNQPGPINIPAYTPICNKYPFRVLKLSKICSLQELENFLVKNIKLVDNPKVNIIYEYRDPRSLSYSRKLQYGEGWVSDLNEENLCSCASKNLKYLAEIPKSKHVKRLNLRFLTYRYQDTIRNPRRIAQKLANWLDLDKDENSEAYVNNLCTSPMKDKVKSSITKKKADDDNKKLDPFIEECELLDTKFFKTKMEDWYYHTEKREVQMIENFPACKQMIKDGGFSDSLHADSWKNKIAGLHIMAQLDRSERKKRKFEGASKDGFEMKEGGLPTI